MSKYGSVKYWENRYESTPGITFDWLEDYSTCKDLLGQLVKKNNSILNLGCGNGIIQEKMYDDGYTEIMNVDISKSVVDYMTERSRESRPNLKYKTADITDLSECFDDNTYDVIFDKGTLDTMLCYSKPSVTGAKVLKEV